MASAVREQFLATTALWAWYRKARPMQVHEFTARVPERLPVRKLERPALASKRGAVGVDAVESQEEAAAVAAAANTNTAAAPTPEVAAVAAASPEREVPAPRAYALLKVRAPLLAQQGRAGDAVVCGFTADTSYCCC